VNIIHRRTLASADDPEALRKQFTDDYAGKFLNPDRAAELGFIDEVIQPSELRAKLCNWLDVLASKRQSLPKKKHGNIPL
jgi:acetyl-CoA carboxylase carboxyltransferase component